MGDKFLSTSGSGNADLTNGTANIFAAILGADNLEPSKAIKTNSVRQLISTNLDISDVNDLQTELDNNISNPFVGTLSATNFDTSTLGAGGKITTSRIGDDTDTSGINLTPTNVDIIATNATINGTDIGDFKSDGTVNMSGSLNMGANSVTNVNLVDGVDVSLLSTTVGTNTTNIGTNTINIGTNDTDITNLQNDKLNIDGTLSMSGSLNMGSNSVTNVNLVDGVDVSLLSTSVGTNTTDITNLQNDKLSKDGSIPMTNNLDLGTNNIINVVDPVNPQDVATKNYTDTNVSNGNYLLKSGGIMTGRITNFQTNDTFVRIGKDAGAVGNSISIGDGSGSGTQSNDAIALGVDCGHVSQGLRAIAIGRYAGYQNQGANAIAIGYDAGWDGQPSESIALNAKTGTVLLPSSSNQMIFQAGTTTLQADATGLTYNGNNVEGDIKSDGTVSMSANLDMGTNNIINTVDPVNPQDVATKNYNDTINSIIPTGGKLELYGGLYVGGLTNRRPVMSGGWSQTAAGVAVTNTTVETSILGTGVGSLTVPADSMKSGTVSHSTLGGIIQTQGNSRSLTLSVYSGATVLFSGLYELAQTLPFASAWKLNIDMSVSTAGISGLISTIGTLSFGQSSGQSDVRTIFNAASINTTVDNTFDVRVTWTTAELGNYIQCGHAVSYNIYQPQ